MPDDERNISRNVAHLNILVHDVINLLYYHTKEYSNTFDPTTIFLQREKSGLNIKEPNEAKTKRTRKLFLFLMSIIKNIK